MNEAWYVQDLCLIPHTTLPVVLFLLFELSEQNAWRINIQGYLTFILIYAETQELMTVYL